jgi:hypothetical protein
LCRSRPSSPRHRLGSLRIPAARGDGVTATSERLLGEVRPVAFRSDPSLGLGEQSVHLGQNRPRGRSLAFECLDSLEAMQYGARFVHDDADATPEIRTGV